jgi:hypothetical protein
MSMQLLRRGCSAPLSVNPNSLVTQPSSLFCRVDFEGGNANVAQQSYGPKNSCHLCLQKAHFRRITWLVEFLCRFGVFSRIDSFGLRYRQKLENSKDCYSRPTRAWITLLLCHLTVTETKLWFQRVLFWTHLTKANHVGSSKTLPKHQRLLDCIKVRAVSCEYPYSLATTHGIQQYQIVVAEHLIPISFGEVLPGICKPGDSCLPDGKS